MNINRIEAKFLASIDDYNEADIVIAGLPIDSTCSFRPGARFGPQKIREVSIGLEEYSPYLERSIDEYKFIDIGDIELPFGDVPKSIEIIYEVAKEIVEYEKFPLFLGGEHLITYPIIKYMAKRYDDLVLIQLDAHADLRDDYLGCKNSHASVMRRCLEHIPSSNLYQFGIRSGTKQEFDFAKENTNFYPFEVYVALKEVTANIGNRPVYFTLDIDVVDPAYANGTGTPEACGITPIELMKCIHLMKDVNLVGFDITEVSPPYDHSDRTALLAAKVVREIIAVVGGKHENIK